MIPVFSVLKLFDFVAIRGRFCFLLFFVLFCVLQEQLGKPVKLTMGEYTNLKLTTPEDMIVATTILESRE